MFQDDKEFYIDFAASFCLKFKITFSLVGYHYSKSKKNQKRRKNPQINLT